MHVTGVGGALVDKKRPTHRFVPRVHGVLAPTTQQGTHAHLAESVGPIPFPRVALAGFAVDLLQAEKAPSQLQVVGVAHLAQPQRRLVGERAHGVDPGVNGGRRRRHDW